MTRSEAVADAGPLIHLDEASAAEALHAFRRIVVPAPVADEVRVQARGPGTRLLRERHIHVTRPSKDEQDNADALLTRRLSGTDRLAVVMAQARDAMLLTDDLELRDVARSLEVRVAGSVGLVVLATLIGLVTKDQGLAALDALLADSSLYVTPAVIARAKAAL